MNNRSPRQDLVPASLLCLIVAVACLGVVGDILPAQNLKVIPSAYAGLEGNSSNTYPFGRQIAELQILIDGFQISKSLAVMRSLNLRPDETTTGYPAYSKQYTLTLFPTTVTAATMTIDPNANAGTARGTQVFAGLMNLAAQAPRTVWPAGFDIKFPFQSTYTLDASKSNLLAHIRTNDQVTPPTSPGRWALDGIFFSDTSLGNEKAKIGYRCQDSNGGYLNLTAGTGLNVGGSLSLTLALGGGATAGTWPTAILGLGVTTRSPGFPLDLSGLGMPGCILIVDPVLAPFLNESGGTYPAFTPAVPNNNSLHGAVFLAQALGATKNGLLGGVVTDAWQLRIGPAQAQTHTIQSIFMLASTSGNRWSISPTGAYCPVVQLDGVFP
jgi:hypothetical protein